jgi:hypothetical protein
MSDEFRLYSNGFGLMPVTPETLVDRARAIP